MPLCSAYPAVSQFWKFPVTEIVGKHPQYKQERHNWHCVLSPRHLLPNLNAAHKEAQIIGTMLTHTSNSQSQEAEMEELLETKCSGL